MAIAFVQTATNFGASNPLAATAFGSNVTSGNLIVVGLTSTGSVPPQYVTDNFGNYYQAIGQFGNASFNVVMSVFFAKNVVGGASFVCTAKFNTAASANAIIASEFSGLALNNPIDRAGFRYASNPAVSPQTPTLPLTRAANELVVSFEIGTTSAVTVGSGYSNFTNINVGANDFMATQSKVISAVGEYNATYVGNTTNQWLTHIATFSDTDLSVNLPIAMNNYQSPKAGDGMSVTERIR